ncbi:hypothetical protein [Sphingobium fuliginis]|uniref:hypothetical protein n=1 Tax=Sphingobium fuliginis (strain ATCC 27551) TaxID=336203 RepID=UPI0037C6CD99
MATLVSTAAIPTKNEPSIITIADSFFVRHVPHLFSCRKGDSAMAVLIRPIPDSVRLSVTGDIETILTVPYEDDDRFLIALSDGTLLLGCYDDKLECRWDIAREGAGMVHFTGNGVRVEWRLEWATVSIYDPNVAEPPLPQALPLFPTLDRWAA